MSPQCDGLVIKTCPCWTLPQLDSAILLVGNEISFQVSIEPRVSYSGHPELSTKKKNVKFVCSLSFNNSRYPDELTFVVFLSLLSLMMMFLASLVTSFVLDSIFVLVGISSMKFNLPKK